MAGVAACACDARPHRSRSDLYVDGGASAPPTLLSSAPYATAQRSHGQVTSEDGATEGACRDSHPRSVGGGVDRAGAAQKGGRK